MKKISFVSLGKLLIMFTMLIQSSSVLAQNSKAERISDDAMEAKAAFIKTDPSMETLFKNSYGYVIFPNIGKGAVGVGGAAGNGSVYEKGVNVGSASMRQVSIGLQLGGQKYQEVIFFENKEALDHFKANKIEFSGQISAIVAKEGASANAQYRDGVSVFTQGKGGLMVEASVGGQKFKYIGFE